MIGPYIAALVADARAGGNLLEQLDAAEECHHGRLPFDMTPECGCWHRAVRLALIQSETTEFVAGLDERRADRRRLGRDMAQIVLIVSGAASHYGIDLGAEISDLEAVRPSPRTAGPGMGLAA